MVRNRSLVIATVVVAVLFGRGVSMTAQVGKGLLDVNTVSEKELLTLPHMTPAIVKGILEHKPFASIVDLNAFLASQSLTPEQLTEVYRKAFIHVNLNTGTREEILLIPGAGNRMVREFAEYRPWKTWAQFDKEIGKYVGPEATAQLAQYCFIPLNLNTATDEEILTIPGAGPRMAREFKEYRPWKTWAQFDKEIGKYVDATEVNRLKQYVFIPIDLNTATDDQLKTIPNLAANMIHELKEYRPWKTKAQFDKEIGKYVGAKETARILRFVAIK
jgi:DNA uptake protein ComE-like DNA-binding protein